RLSRYRCLPSFPTRRSSDLRDRDAPAREAVAVVVEHHAQRGHERAVVLQRLAHAHHHDVADGALAFGQVQTLAQMMLGEPELGEDRKSTRLNSSHVSISYAV